MVRLIPRVKHLVEDPRISLAQQSRRGGLDNRADDRFTVQDAASPTRPQCNRRPKGDSPRPAQVRHARTQTAVSNVPPNAAHSRAPGYPSTPSRTVRDRTRINGNDRGIDASYDLSGTTAGKPFVRTRFARLRLNNPGRRP